METEPSTWIVIAMTAVGAVVWLAGLAVMARATRELRARAQDAAARFDIEERSAAGTLVGEGEVDGRPEELSDKLAGLLARDGMPPFGPVKIVACDRGELVFESAGPGAGAPGMMAGGVRSGRFRFSPVGSRTRIEYAIEAPSGRVLIAMGWLFVVLGLAALAAGCWIMFAYVIPSPNPGVRGQALQMVQVCHFLWPPFLFAALSRQPARMIQARVSAMIHNLPYS
jgi:hypothetical protein